MFFAQKMSNLGPVRKKPMQLKQGDFCDFEAKLAILTPFQSHFACF